MIKKLTDKIIVEDSNFNIKQILECGQVFSFCLIDKNKYRVVSGNKVAIVNFSGDVTEIATNDVEYFYNYFDLNTNYNKINAEIIKIDREFEKYISTNLYILKQDPYQTIISFIVSANNNIKRITTILNKISAKFGTFLKPYNCYSFPTIAQLSKATEEDFTKLGCGYRAKYLVESIKKLSTEEYNAENLKKLDSINLKEKLLKLSGVGPKVADCILLFGFARTDFFPVDTWIRKAYFNKFPNKKTSDKEIAKYYVGIFKNYSGYAQQYLYNYMLPKKVKIFK